MEDVGKWHHGVPSDEEYTRALAEFDAALAGAPGGLRMSAPAPSMYSDAAKQTAARLGLKPGRAKPGSVCRHPAGTRQPPISNVIAVTSDSRGSGKLGPYGQALPKQIVEVGIAEQNLVGIAAGLASVGKTVFAVSPACFLTARSFEQIKNDVAYSDNPVTLVGISAGVSYGALGTTHHSLHDFAALRAVNNLSIIAPADNFEAREAVMAAAKLQSPVYLRFGKAALYDLPADTAFTVGSSRLIRPGDDAAFIASGETVIHALLAAQHLAETAGLNCRVVSMPTIKPIDADAIFDAAAECSAIVTVEEHMVNGGLGEACAALIAQSGLAPKFKIVGIPDEYTVTGSQADIFRHYGISMEGLSATMQNLLSD